MGYLRFYRRKKILPGVSLNFSKSGISTSFGVRGARFTVGPRGTRTTVGIPGTGVSYVENKPARRRSAGCLGASTLAILTLCLTIILAACGTGAVSSPNVGGQSRALTSDVPTTVPTTYEPPPAPTPTQVAASPSPTLVAAAAPPAVKAPATKAPTHPPTSAPKPATAPPAACHSSAPANPWGYDFCAGATISAPPTNFCSYFSCIPNFWKSTNGYVEQCSDGMFSHSGGRQGSCSYHGGNKQPLFSH